MAFKTGTSGYGSFYLSIAGVSDIVTVNTDSGNVTREPDIRWQMLETMKKGNQKRNYGYWQSFNTINNLKHLQINDKGNIVVNKHEIVFTTHTVQLIRASGTNPDHSIHNTELLVKLSDTRQSLSKYRWPDGSEAWFDRYRHMLYLRSSNKLLAEVAIVLVVNQATACQASDDTTCGYSYFVPDGRKNIDPQAFHEKYIKPFIQVIQQHGTPTVI